MQLQIVNTKLVEIIDDKDFFQLVFEDSDTRRTYVFPAHTKFDIITEKLENEIL
jgi:hypothetical protein